MLKAFIRFFILLVSFATLAHATGPTVKKTKVNGFEVYLINTHVGNGVALTANVQTGAWFDEPVHHAGRAHLWEHIIHAGSKAFPGHTTFDDLNAELGADYNAYTGHTRTFYHYYMHPDAFPKAAKILGATLSAPEWNEATFKKELSTVMDEARSYQEEDTQAFFNGAFVYLSPSDHRLSMYEVGTQAQLSAMTLNDLKQLYYSNYVPGSLQIIVARNLDASKDGSPSLTEADILSEIKNHFHIPRPENNGDSLELVVQPNTQVKFTSIVRADPTQPRMIELGSTTPRRLFSMTFEADGAFNPFAQETLFDYLNLTNEGSLNHYLVEKGWMISMSAQNQKANNFNIIQITASLTPEGSAHRNEISELFFSVLNEIKQNGIKPEILEYLKQRNIASYEKSNVSAAGAADFLARSLELDSDGTRAFHFKEHYGTVTQADIAAALAHSFSTDRMLTTYLGPEIEGPADPLFNRPMKLTDNSAFRGELKKIWMNGNRKTSLKFIPQINSIPLNVTAEARGNAVRKPTQLKTQQKGETLIFEENHSSLMGGINLTLHLQPSEIEEIAALRLFVHAFWIRNSGIYDFLSSNGISLSVEGSQDLSFTTEGNASAALSALNWAFSNIIHFNPKQSELVQAATSIQSGYDASQSKFTASVAAEAASSLVWIKSNRKRSLEAIQKLKNDPDKIMNIVKKMFSKMDITVLAAGDYLEPELREVLEQTATQFPKRLSQNDRVQNKKKYRKVTDTLDYWTELNESKPEDDFGLARVFDGPKYLTREGVAISFITGILHQRVFAINRIREELGYVHSVASNKTKDSVKIVFYGQAQGIDNMKRMQAGWEEVIAMVQNKTLTQDNFEMDKRGALRELTLLPNTIANALHSLMKDQYQYGNLNVKERYIEILKSLTPNEIYAAARKYLVNRPHWNVLASRFKTPVEAQSCDEILTNPEQIDEVKK